MITDEERSETAENLRCLSYTNRVRYKEEFYELLDETVMDPDTGYHEMNDVFERLADLIEPVPERTCRMIDNGAELCCSECDWRHDYDDEPKFCAGCGAEVVDE